MDGGACGAGMAVVAAGGGVRVAVGIGTCVAGMRRAPAMADGAVPGAAEASVPVRPAAGVEACAVVVASVAATVAVIDGGVAVEVIPYAVVAGDGSAAGRSSRPP